MKTCLFGGAFDPVHSGHLMIARAVIESCKPERFVFLPAACSPFKIGQRNLFTAEERMEMLRVAVREMEHAEVSDLDLKLPPPSWTWRLVEHWKKENPGEQLFWLLGMDEWNELHRWSRLDRLSCELTFIVCQRSEKKAVPRPGIRVVFMECPEHPASSSELRRLLEEGKPVPPGWLPEAVLTLIRKYLAGRG